MNAITISKSARIRAEIRELITGEHFDDTQLTDNVTAWLNNDGRVVRHKNGIFEFVRYEADRCGPQAIEWSRLVMERDNFRCVECDKGSDLQAHHIKEWADYPELRFDLNNGKTLCRKCHSQKHPGRENLILKAHCRNKRTKACGA